ncbi:MAG TPA: hypothetical protein VK509_13505 [Polyangiales bacterium]|nr:hypothetical protein [Polyangiales bacterium]
MYLVTLYLHSWLRYLVLGLGLWLLVAAARGKSGTEWSGSDERLHVRFLAVLDTQFVLGLLLYFVLSPLTAAAMSNFGAAMKDANLRFYGVEHIATMFLAVASAHIGRVRSKRKTGGARHKTTLIFQVIWLVLTLLAIPWPMLDSGRPLFRF